MIPESVMYVELFQSTKGVTVVPRVLGKKSSADFYNVANPFLLCSQMGERERESAVCFAFPWLNAHDVF
jgi:hypothetical protein